MARIWIDFKGEIASFRGIHAWAALADADGKVCGVGGGARCRVDEGATF